MLRSSLVIALCVVFGSPALFAQNKEQDRLEASAVVLQELLDVPDNITPIFQPSRAPELNPVENIWQYLRANWLSNRLFETYDEIIEAACDAWQKLIAKPETISSIGMRQWAHVGQTQ